MENKRELYSINDCKTIDDMKELQRQRYKRWYTKNQDHKKAYSKNYYATYLSKEARENN